MKHRLIGVSFLWLLISFVLPPESRAVVTTDTLQKTGQSQSFSGDIKKSENEKKQFKEDELLVKFKQDVTKEKKEKLHKKLGSMKLKEFKSIKVQHLKLKKGLTVEEAIKQYQADPDVEYAEPNYLRSVQGLPNDPAMNQLWGLSNYGQTGGVPDADIDAPEAWDISTGSSGVVVGVIDTGVDYGHADLAANMWTNPGEIPGNGVDDDGNGYVDDIYGIDTINNDTDPMDDHGHGTHCAGTIGAVGNNGIGVVGVNWDVEIAACKFLGSGGSGYDADAVECLEYFAELKDRGVNVVVTSNSWGGGGFNQTLRDAIQAQLDKDVLFVAAAGNSSLNNDYSAHFPSSYDIPSVIAVAATNHADGLAYFSNYGRQTVHVGAPGEGILSTLPVQNYWSIQGGYGTLSGTSMAAPHVAGLAALLQAQDSSRDWQTLKNLILTSGDDLPALEYTTVTGKRINSLTALSCSGEMLLSPLNFPWAAKVGESSTLRALSLECGQSRGPLTVTLSQGEQFNLLDDGNVPDEVAGDGVFSASWIPVRLPEHLSLSSPAGVADISIPPLLVSHYLPAANLGSSYDQPLRADGGFPPLTWTLAEGNLPAGLSLDGATGRIAGTPTAEGKGTFTVQANDTFGWSRKQVVALEITTNPLKEVWARPFLSPGNDYGRNVDTDDYGNVYVVGEYANGTNLDLLVLKYSSDGSLLWSKAYDHGSDERGFGIVATADGGAVVAGSTGLWETWSRDHLILRLSAAGEVDWVQATNKGGDDIAWNVALDNSGNILVVGEVYGNGNDDVATTKYDASGVEIWTRTYDGGSADYAYGIGADAAGNVFITGAEAQPVPLGELTTYDAMTIKYDPAGTFLWRRLYDTGSIREFAESVAVDGSGNVHVVGSTEDLPAEIFVLKYDNGGTLLWDESYQPGYSVSASDIALDGEGNVYAVGYAYNGVNMDILTLQYGSSGGLVWERFTDGGGTDEGHGISISPDGGIVVTGLSYNGAGVDFLTLQLEKTLPQVSTLSLPGGLFGMAYSENLAATGGIPPYTWVLTSGNLPPGLALAQASGVISGTPTAGGDYSFEVSATDTEGSSVAKQLEIQIIAVIADFSVINSTGQVPLPVSFTDTTLVGVPTAWLWSFGDGVTSTQQHPVHIYAEGGTYSVSLTVTNPFGIDTLTKTDLINVQSCPSEAVRVFAIGDYPDLQNAYSNVPAYSGRILARGQTFTGPLTFNRAAYFKLEGGYDCGFGSRPFATVVDGKMTVTAGKVVLDKIKFISSGN